jgi:Flp pilus assembly protein TadB
MPAGDPARSGMDSLQADKSFPAIGQGAPAARQLPPGGSKINRISQHAKGLAQDLSAWVELKMKLAQVEVMEQMDVRVAELKKEAVAGVLAAVGGFFFLIALALGVAALFIAIGLSYPLSYFLGFLLVAILFLGFAAATHRARTRARRRQVRVDDSKLIQPPPPGRNLPTSVQ